MILAVCANPSVDSFWEIESVTKGTTNRSTGEQYYPGGKGLHVAFALNELGETVTTLGVWGGITGRWLKEQCEHNNIQTVGPEVAGWTRLCITNKSTSEWNETEFLGGGPSLAHEQTEAFVQAYNKQLKVEGIEAVVISGSTPNGFDNTIYKRLIETANSNGIPAFVDAKKDLLVQALEAKPYAVHINQAEGRDITGSDDPREIACWLKRRCQVAAVTAGADGLYLAVNNQIYHASHKLNKDKVISTIGSGDCLTAGLCKAFLRSNDHEQWARLATACGSANCIHPQLGMLTSDDVNEIVNQVHLEIL